MAHRTVLVTGASTGIGEACAARLAASGWKVYAGVRRDADGDRLVAEHSGEISPVLLDVVDQDSIEAAVAGIDEEVGTLDGLVNNAGVGVGGPFELLGVDEWREQFDVNVFGVLAVTKAAFPLVERASGRFVHIGSIAGRVASPGLGPYAASKHALEAVNWSLRAEFARIGTMNSSLVEPGEIQTKIWDKAEEQLHRIEQRLADAGLAERYEWLTSQFVGFLDEAKEKAIEPERVADAVEHALTAKRPKARYLVGTDAKLQAAIAHLPDRGREFALGKALTKYIKDGEKLRAGAES